MTEDPTGLNDHDIAAATHLRRALHAAPELSGHEERTAATMAAALADAGADQILTRIGRHGVAAIFSGEAPGPTIVLRAELDALPIREETELPHRSGIDGHGHLCGHDGHMAILYAVARVLGRRPRPRGRAIVLLQPAEETGMGAEAVIADGRIAGLRPDRIFALHNLPGLSFGRVSLADGLAACASRGMRIALSGRTAHASQPETGLSPAGAIAALMDEVSAIGSGAAFPDPEFAVATITHVEMGERAFGIAPGAGEVWATLRTLSDAAMARLVARAETLAHSQARAAGLGCGIDYREVFDACENHPDAAGDLRRAMDDLGVRHGPEGQPWKPSEDFGRFACIAPSAMFFIGAGTSVAPLHDPRYDFPDALVGPAARIFLRAIERGAGDR